MIKLYHDTTSTHKLILGNAAEHVSSVTFAMKNKMNLCIGIAISSSLQIGLLVSPVLVLTGWFIDVPMTFFFEIFETVVLFASVMIVNYLIADGKSNWLEGALLLVSLFFSCNHMYSIKLTCVYFRPFIPLLPWHSFIILLFKRNKTFQCPLPPWVAGCTIFSVIHYTPFCVYLRFLQL